MHVTAVLASRSARRLSVNGLDPENGLRLGLQTLRGRAGRSFKGTEELLHFEASGGEGGIRIRRTTQFQRHAGQRMTPKVTQSIVRQTNGAHMERKNKV